MPLLSPGAAQYTQFMFEGRARYSKFFVEGFELMAAELKQILKTNNITILQLFREIAIE